MKSFVVFCLLIFLAACTNVPFSAPTPISLGMETIISPTVTSNPADTLVPTISQTLTPLPTKANTPNSTLGSVPTRNVLDRFEPSDGEGETLLEDKNEDKDEVEAEDIEDSSLKVLDRFESPDGEWVALLEGENAYTNSASYTFHVVNRGGDLKWVVESFGYEGNSLSGFDNRIPIYWSENGKYMYYVHHQGGDGCGPEQFGYDLYRADLQNGQTVELIPKGQWFAVSPDEKRVAYLLNSKLVFHDLATSEEVVIELDYDPAIEYINFSDITWSPDSGSLLIFGAEDVCATGMLLDGRYFINRIDAQSYIQTTIAYDSSLRRIISWTEPDKVEIYIDGGSAWLNPDSIVVI